jgi:hypothetical protein
VRREARDVRLAGFGRAAALVVLAVAGLDGLPGCGGAGYSGDVAVRIGQRKITAAAVAHWIPIEARLAYEVVPQRPVPRGVVPDPPDYTACVAYLRKPNPSGAGGASVSRAQLRKACAERYTSIKQHVLDILIRYQWLLGEAADRGLRVSDAQARGLLQQQERTQGRGAFRRYVSYTGLTSSDVLLRVRYTILESEVFGGGGAGVRGERQRLRTVAEFNSRWRAKTDCSPGYVIADCRQYGGSY